MPSTKFPKVRGIKYLTMLDVQLRSGGTEARIEYSMKANPKILGLLKRIIPLMDGYTNYMKFYTGRLVVVVSCRDYADHQEMAQDFTTSFLETLQTELDERREEAAALVEFEAPPAPSESQKGLPPVYRSSSRFAVR